MTAGLRALNLLASSPVVDRFGLREPTERLLGTGTRTAGRTAARAGRTFAAAQKLAGPARQGRGPGSGTGAFSLKPTDEQEMLADSVRSFALDKLRPAAVAADAGLSTPPEILSQAMELGLSTIGVPETLGGALEERSAVTAALISEALGEGDLSMALACLAPAAVSTAISLWGDAGQQATYLPAFLGDDVPAAALALQEPTALFDPFRLSTTATSDPNGDGYVLTGVKSLVPLVAEAELMVVAAQLDDRGPALFIVEAALPGISVQAEPAMGLRAAATGTLNFTAVELPASALLGGGASEVYSECVALARIAWCALAMGTGRAVLGYVTAYVNERTAFGEPVSHRQAVAFNVANIAIELEGIRLATLRAAARADRGLPFAREAALARRLVAEHGMRIGSDGVGLLGGHGYTKEHPVERWYRDLRAAGMMEGMLLL